MTSAPSSGTVAVRIAHGPRRRPWDSPWIAFGLRRLVALAGTFLLLAVISFLIVQLLPGDPAVAIAGPDATSFEVEAIRTQLGLDQPLPLQFAHYMGDILTGNLGTSFQYGQPVATIIGNRLPYTALIAFSGIAIVLLIAVPLGMAVGVATRGGRRGWLDTGFGAITGFIDAVPSYIMATFLVIVFGLGIGLIPLFPPVFSPRSGAVAFVLPVIALIVGPIATISRVVRRETAVVWEQDYIRTARGWRVSSVVLYLKYTLPNILTTTLTLSGLIVGAMLGGALIIEAVFAVPGLGSGIIKAILDRDYPVIQGMVVFIGMVAALVNLAVDVLLALIDSRNLGGRHDG